MQARLCATRTKVNIRTVNFRSIEYIIQEAFTGIQRNGFMAFASISTIALSLAVLGAFVLSSLGANHFASAQIDQFEIVAFSKDNDEARINATADRIGKMNGVVSVKVRSRDAEWADFKRKNPNFESAGLPLNPLPYRIDVRVKDHSRTEAIANKIRMLDSIDAVKSGRETLGRVMAVAKVVKGVSIAGVIILLITTAFIISNAIKLTLYARRREIRIMQLVGATNQFIRIPLVIEGIVFGASGAFCAWILLGIGGTYVTHAAKSITPLLGRFSSGVQPGILALSLVVLGAVIGAAGSLVSIRRFLKD